MKAQPRRRATAGGRPPRTGPGLLRREDRTRGRAHTAHSARVSHEARGPGPPGGPSARRPERAAESAASAGCRDPGPARLSPLISRLVTRDHSCLETRPTRRNTMRNTRITVTPVRPDGQHGTSLSQTKSEFPGVGVSRKNPGVVPGFQRIPTTRGGPSMDTGSSFR